MRFSFAAAILTVLAASLHGQIATTTSLVGTVTDSSGKTIGGAKVSAVNKGTLDTYNTTTNEQGNYRVEFVRVGTYNVTVEQPGFQRLAKTDIVVDINQVVRTDFTLTIGAVSQSVTRPLRRPSRRMTPASPRSSLPAAWKTCR